MTRIYNAYEIKRKCEKLYSDIICFNIYNLSTKDAQWELYNEKINEIVNCTILLLNFGLNGQTYQKMQIKNLMQLKNIYYL